MVEFEEVSEAYMKFIKIVDQYWQKKEMGSQFQFILFQFGLSKQKKVREDYITKIKWDEGDL